MSVSTETAPLEPDPRLWAGVPEGLFPTPEDARLLPTLLSQDLIQLKAAGWARVGIVAAILNEAGQVLMLEHKASPKNAEGALGPLSETSKANSMWVESPALTLHRAIRQELGIEDPSLLELQAPRAFGAWALNHWPVNGRDVPQYALAVSPAMVVPKEAAKHISRFVNSAEIRRTVFMDPEAIATHGNLRPGTINWLGDMAASGLLEQPATGPRLNFYGFNKLSDDWEDAIFDEMDLDEKPAGSD